MWKKLLILQQKNMNFILVGSLAVFMLLITLYYMFFDKDRSHTQKPKSSAKGNDPGRKYNFHGQEERLDILYTQHFPFYKNLQETQKREFIERVLIFIHTSIFIPRHITMGPDMVSLFSASFVHLTFGMPKKVLLHFNYIIIYPERYKNENTGHYHKGDVHLEGSISISWKDFMHGYNKPEDGINLGLHELSHALCMEILKYRNRYPELFKLLQPVFMRAQDEISGKRPRNNILREYAFANLHEYMAVATEVYFEQPKILESGYPELYFELKSFYHPMTRLS